LDDPADLSDRIQSGQPRLRSLKSLAFGAVDDHPFRTAWRTREIDTWIDALSPEIVLHSPVVRTPFRGRPAARELYGVLFDTFGEVEITGELADADSHAFFWRANIAGRVIEGADRLRYDDQEKIAEIRVLIRPLVDIAAFAAAIGPPLAARRSPMRGALVRLLTLPLKSHPQCHRHCGNPAHQTRLISHMG
jgi:hypothetical protein